MSTKNTSKNAITLNMVAQRAGVSAATVSRIINGTAKVSAKKRQLIEQAIADLNFTPNFLARGLAMGATSTIGVITQAIDSPFYAEGLLGIEATLAKHGYTPIFMSGHWDAKIERQCLQQLIDRKVDGIIFFSGMMQDEHLRQFAQNLPILVTGRHIQGDNIVSVYIDDARGAEMATQHLIDLGHRNIVHIVGPRSHPDALARLAGYKNALQNNGIRYSKERVIQGDFQYHSGMLAVTTLLKKRINFSAIFCANDQIAHGALLSLHQHGLKIPQDISIVGFDNLLASNYSIPPLTSVNQSIYTLGQISADCIHMLISGNKPQFTLPDIQLVVRNSTQSII